MALNPEHTNRMTCTVCGWTRVIDHQRYYRSGHTNPNTNSECHEMLVFEEINTSSPEPWMFEIEVPYEEGMEDPNA